MSCTKHLVTNLSVEAVSAAIITFLAAVRRVIRRDCTFDFRRLRRDDLTAVEVQHRAYEVIEQLKRDGCVSCLLDENLLLYFPVLYLGLRPEDAGLADVFLQEVISRCEADVFLREKLLEPPVPEDLVTERLALLTGELDAYAVRYDIRLS